MSLRRPLRDLKGRTTQRRGNRHLPQLLAHRPRHIRLCRCQPSTPTAGLADRQLDWEDYVTTDDEDEDGQSDAGSFTSAASSPDEAKPSRDEPDEDEGEGRRRGVRSGAALDDGRAADALAVAVERLSMDTGHDR